MRDSFIRRLTQLAEQDPKIILVTGDLGFKVFDEYRERFPRQFLNAGVAEQNMIGVSAGLALEGFTVFAYSIGNFPSLRCLEQIRNDVCYHKANVKVVSVGAGFSYGSLGVTHHATEDLTILRALPEICVVSPGDDWEAEEATEQLCRQSGPAYLRLDRSSAGNTRQPGEDFQLGKPRVLRSGGDICLLTTGGMLAEVLKASDILGEQGISSSVIQIHTVKPFDILSIANVLEASRLVITVEEHTVQGGLGGLIAEEALEAGIVIRSFRRLGLRGIFSEVVGGQEYLRMRYGFDAEAIVDAAKRE